MSVAAFGIWQQSCKSVFDKCEQFFQFSKFSDNQSQVFTTLIANHVSSSTSYRALLNHPKAGHLGLNWKSYWPVACRQFCLNELNEPYWLAIQWGLIIGWFYWIDFFQKWKWWYPSQLPLITPAFIRRGPSQSTALYLNNSKLCPHNNSALRWVDEE